MTATEFKPKQRADRDVTTYAEFTGLRNDISPERFDATDLVVANNVTLDKSRRLARRAGATLRRAGACHSLWAAGDMALFGAGTGLYRLDDQLTATLLTNNLSGSPLCYARANDTTYFSDGHSTGVALPSSTRSWGLVVPMVMATIVAGDLTPGHYGIAATYVRRDGQESGAAASTLATVGVGQSMMFTVPASLDTDVVERRLYMTPPDGEILYHVATLPNDASVFTPAAADVAALNEPLTTQFMGPPPAASLLAYYKGHMFAAVGDVLFYSEPFAYELFDPRKYIQLDGPITMLAPMEDKGGDASGFFVGTAKSCGVLTGGGPEDFAYTPKTDYGSVPGALAYVDGALYLDGAVGARPLPMWLTTQGLCAGLPNLEVNNLTRSRYAFAASGQGAAMFDPVANMFVAVSDDHPAVAMQIENQTLTTFTEFGYNSFARVAGRNLAARDDGLFELVGNDDNGLPISGTVTLATTDFGSAFAKTIDRLFVGYRSQADMVLRVVTDDEHTNYYTLPVSAQPGLATQRVKVGKGVSGRYWQFTLQNLDGTDFAFDTVDVKSVRLARRINGRA